MCAQDYGQVPNYIRRRKEEIREEKEALECAAIEEANQRCRAITDEERQAIIDVKQFLHNY